MRNVNTSIYYISQTKQKKVRSEKDDRLTHFLNKHANKVLLWFVDVKPILVLDYLANVWFRILGPWLSQGNFGHLVYGLV
jgi:hypothetical protein